MSKYRIQMGHLMGSKGKTFLPHEVLPNEFREIITQVMQKIEPKAIQQDKRFQDHYIDLQLNVYKVKDFEIFLNSFLDWLCENFGEKVANKFVRDLNMMSMES